MSFNDPIAQMLTLIRNALLAKHKFVDFPLTKMRTRMLEIFKKEGYIENFLTNQEKRKIRVFLKYHQRKPVIQGLKRASKPGKRIYAGAKEIPYVRNKLGTAIVTTSKGIMTAKEAKQQNSGGEVLCYIW